MGSGEGLFTEAVALGADANNVLREKPDAYVYADENKEKESERIKAFLTEWSKKKEFPNATGITLQMKREKPTDNLGKLAYHTDYLENLSDETITRKNAAGKADIITDVYGAFSYAPDTAGLLKRYTDLLKPNGKIFIFGTVKGVVVRGDGTRVSLLDYISKEIPGLKVKQYGPKENGRPKVLEISLDPAVKVNIPPIELKFRSDEDPPLMLFQAK